MTRDESLIKDIEIELVKVIVLIDAIDGYLAYLDKYTNNDKFRNDLIFIKLPLVRRRLALEIELKRIGGPMKDDKKETMLGFRISEKKRKKIERIAEKNKRTVSQILQIWTDKLIKKGDI